MKSQVKKRNQLFTSILLPGFAFFVSANALAITFDWKGYFRANHNYVRNYQMGSGAPENTDVTAASGEFIRSEGAKSASFTSFFAKLKPSILVNDNVIIHSEWNLGDPVLNFFGRGVDLDQDNNPVSTRKGELTMEAARLWLDVHTDFGLLQVGRAPMNWGLGVIFNKGDGVHDRFQSTSDTIRIVSKFGHFSIIPIYSKVAMGKNIAGAQDPSGTVLDGSDDVTDFGVGIKYHNEERELEAGLLLYKRDAKDQQDTFLFPHNANRDSENLADSNGSNGLSLRLLDLYARKTWSRLTVGAEIPIYTGEVGDVNNVESRNSYKATGFAGEVTMNFNRWKHMLKFGSAPGQNAVTTGDRGKEYGAMYFHRNYKLGQILFNYKLGGFGSNNPDIFKSRNDDNNNGGSLRSPYDSAISNAKYIMLGTENQGENWSWSLGLVYALASESAQKGKDFYIHRLREYSAEPAVEDQGENLGLELDLGAGYKWDENIHFGADFGVFFPGDYYEFDNKLSQANPADPVMSVTFTAGIVF